MIKQNQKYINRLFIVLDGLLIFLSLVLSWFIRFKSGLFAVGEGFLSLSQYIYPALFIIPMYLLIYSLMGLYSSFRHKEISVEFITILKANVLAFLVFILVLFIFKIVDYSRYLLAVFVVLSTLILTLERFILRITLYRIRENGYNKKYVLMVGMSELAREFIKKVVKNKKWGYEVVGIVDDHVKSGYSDYKMIGVLEDLEQLIYEKEIDEVFITIDIKEYGKLRDIIRVCEKSGVRASIIPDYYKYLPARPYVEELEGMPIINIRYVPLDDLLNRFFKRSMDVLGSLSAIIVFSPVMLVTAITIKITSPGPVIFKQERVGYNRKTFTMYKFRSMKVQKEEEEAKAWTTKNDPRKTKFGEFIRKTSIDELPQFFNVLLGDMSLVGPRPERPYFVEQFKEEISKYMVKHHVRPGITGWAQINGWRGDTSIKKRIEFDLYYIENWSLWFDIKILWLTVFKGFVNKNAY